MKKGKTSVANLITGVRIVCALILADLLDGDTLTEWVRVEEENWAEPFEAWYKIAIKKPVE